MPQTQAFRGQDRYLQLVRAFPLRPIRSAQAHQQAKAMLRRLAGQTEAAVADYKAVLVSLIAEYERNAGHELDISQLGAADIIRHLLEERSMSVNALAHALSLSQSALSQMLNGKRDWSKSVIVRLADY